jgi:hypothetical protein
MRKLAEVKAVVVHWDGGVPKDGNVEGLINWMLNERPDGAFYHRFVSGSEVSYGRSTAERCIHCGNNTYTIEATQFFGPYYCPPWDHNQTPHESSPNNCTIGVCLLHDHLGGGYSGETLRTGAALCAELLMHYDLGIEALWTHTDIVGEKTKLCPKAFYRIPPQREYFYDEVKKILKEAGK